MIQTSRPQYRFRPSSPMTTPVRDSTSGSKTGSYAMLNYDGGSPNLSPYSTQNLGFKSWRSMHFRYSLQISNPEVPVCSKRFRVFHFKLGKVSVKKCLFLIPHVFFCWWNYAWIFTHQPFPTLLTNDAWKIQNVHPIIMGNDWTSPLGRRRGNFIVRLDDF